MCVGVRGVNKLEGGMLQPDTAASPVAQDSIDHRDPFGSSSSSSSSWQIHTAWQPGSF